MKLTSNPTRDLGDNKKKIFEINLLFQVFNIATLPFQKNQNQESTQCGKKDKFHFHLKIFREINFQCD